MDGAFLASFFEHLLVQPTRSNGKIRFLRNNDPDTYQAQYIKTVGFVVRIRIVVRVKTDFSPPTTPLHSLSG